MAQPRSPFWLASRKDIKALRALVTAVRHWERALGTPEQYLQVDWPAWAVSRLGYRAGLRVEDRAIRRWTRAAHYEASRAVYRDQHMYRYDRAAWESKHLAAEVGTLRAEVAALKAAIG